MPCSGDTALRSGTAEVTGAVHAQKAALPVKIGELCSGIHAHTPTHQHTPCTLLRVPGTAALRCSLCTPGPTSSSSQHHVPTQAAGSLPSLLHTHTAAGRPPRTCSASPDPCPSLPALRGSPPASAREPVGRDCCGPAPDPERTHPTAPPTPASLTVKMLERRLDCLRMGVGVLEAAMVSIRSSRWLMLGVEGTEEE